MKLILFIFILVTLSSPVFSGTTFFDNSNDAFIMGKSSTQSRTSTGTSQGTTNPSLSYTKGCKREVEINTPSKISINQGETAQISVSIKNIGTCYLKNINVSIDVPIDWKAQSQTINELYVKKNQTINLEIIPSIKATGNHLIKIKAEAERAKTTKELQINIISTSNNEITTQAIKEKDELIINNIILTDNNTEKINYIKIKHIIIPLIATAIGIIIYFLTTYFQNRRKFITLKIKIKKH